MPRVVVIINNPRQELAEFFEIAKSILPFGILNGLEEAALDCFIGPFNNACP